MHPRGLPRASRQLLRHLQDPGSNLRALTGLENQAGLELLASHLQVAELFWVAPDMAALAVSAGTQLAAARWAPADRPSPCGLLWWDGGIGTISHSSGDIPVDGVVWGPAPDSTCLLWWLIDRRRVAEAFAAKGEQLVKELVPPLMPVLGVGMPVTSDPLSMVELPVDAPAVPTLSLAAAWLLMQQPMLTDRSRLRGNGSALRGYGRDELADPEVTIIDLRRRYVPDDVDSHDEDGPGRRYRHRWVVSGHWRNQAYGPRRSKRRQIWVPAYVKGPDGAPLLACERVNVWRR